MYFIILLPRDMPGACIDQWQAMNSNTYHNYKRYIFLH